MNKIPRTMLWSFLVYSIVVLPLNANDQILNLKLLNGSSIIIGTKQEKPLYLKFWASWCGQCRKQMPHLTSIYKKYRNKLTVIAINPGWNERLDLVQQFKHEFKLQMPIALEPFAEVARTFNVTVVPYSVLINKNGKVVHSAFGVGDGLDKKIAQLVRGEL